MANGPKRGKRRSRPKKAKQNNSLLIQSLGSIFVFIMVIFLIAAGILPTTIGAVVCMVILAILFYSMSKPKPRRRRRSRKSKPQDKEPQFYTALPSTLGLSEIPEEIPTPQVKLPPRPIRAARRRRDFITYPLAVGGGDYSDSYVQADKDTILRLRSEMTPDMASLKLSGVRIGKFPSSKIASVMSKEIESSTSQVNSPLVAIPVAGEAVVEAAVAMPVMGEAVVEVAVAMPVTGEAVVEAAVAMPVTGEAVVEAAVAIPVAGEAVVEATPVIQPASTKEKEIDFDMEWD
jgi:Ca2+/Na+ antiporter|tara:strand:- start:3715 stop:4584 length:870 start_codon:yes stop_codon:yes gene_type:complete